VVSFPQLSPSTPVCTSPVSNTCQMMPLSTSPHISFFLLWAPEYQLVRNTDHKAPRFVFSIPLCARPSWVRIFSSAPYSRTSLAMFHHQWERPSFKLTQYKRQNYSSVFRSLYIFFIENWKNKILHRVLALPVFKLVLISSEMWFWLHCVFPRYLNCSTP